MSSINKDVYGLDYANSHLMKNNEWGAVAYLAYSKELGNVPKINGTGSLKQEAIGTIYIQDKDQKLLPMKDIMNIQQTIITIQKMEC